MWEPTDYFISPSQYKTAFFRNTFLSYFVHPKLPFMYKEDSNVLIQNKELRDSEIQVKNLSFLYQFIMPVRASSNERSVGKVKIHCVQVQLWSVGLLPVRFWWNQVRHRKHLQCHIWSLWNGCFFRTALNYFCLVLSPSEIPHLNMKSSTHFNIFSWKSLGKKSVWLLWQTGNNHRIILTEKDL